ncbi:MAG: hypothetical protein QOD30_1371 [Actinomycetota bacterium]|jgi:hypothetical protein|nr:hypothetical protein [Actinomycetota bacterium]
MSERDLQAAFDAVDAENAGDPHGKELDHAERAVRWMRTLRPDASDELLLAARAHHVRRWEIPRAEEPDGRAGYLRWKRRLQQHHADIVGRVLAGSGFDVDRVQSLVKKERLKTDADVQSLEDALALVFLETQLAELNEKLDDDHMVDVLAKTLRKMTPAGRAAAGSLTYDAHGASLVQRAVAAL